MATFSSKLPSTVVWDTIKGKHLCRFSEHLCTTDDAYIIDRLTLLGYERVDVKTENEPPVAVKQPQKRGGKNVK